MSGTKKILIVDDSPLIHHMVGDELERAGYQVLHADDGMAAINTVFTEMPDLIMLDIQMPKINGYQVCRLIKDHPATKSIPVIIMTSPGSTSAGFVSDPRNWSFQTGADGYIDKDGSAEWLPTVEALLKASDKPAVPRTKSRPMSEMEILSAVSKLLDRQLYQDVTRLKELDKRKSAFVANVSHEFRSPLAIIKGNLDLLACGACDPLSEKQKKSVETSMRIVNRLVRLVTDLLDISKIEAGKMKLDTEEVSLPELLEEVVENYNLSLKEKEITLTSEIPKKMPSIVADKDRLAQVFTNLISNAIKYTQKKGSVVMRLADETDAVRFEIEDTGEGIGPEDLKKIFDKFERVTSEKQEGTGLGLPIARDIVVLHNGKIWAESKKGKGSKFVVQLPKASSTIA